MVTTLYQTLSRTCQRNLLDIFAVLGRVGNSITNSLLNNTLCTHACQAPLCAHPNPQLTKGQRPLLFGVRRDLIRGTSEECTLPAIRIWQTTPLIAPRQRMHPAHLRSAACAISSARDYHPIVWSNSNSMNCSASTPALCNNRSCLASALRFANRRYPSPAQAADFGAYLGDHVWPAPVTTAVSGPLTSTAM